MSRPKRSQPAATPSGASRGPGASGTAAGKVARLLASVLFIAFVVWLVNGVAQGGWVRWFAVALFATPIVGLLGFYAWIFIAFVLQGRRNVREAERARREER